MFQFYNEDCITGAQQHLASDSVDLIITDPPYGIQGDKLDKHYNRNENFVLDGYVEIPEEEYADFSHKWIQEAERVLKPGGSIYIVSGYSNLIHILNALSKTQLEERNHIIWKYNFGVYTRKKYVSSHYHILFYTKPGKKHTFNTYARFSDSEKTEIGGSSNYHDREDVWIINREYRPGQVKNKNELPTKLLTKMIQYSSNEGDMICDFFLGSFSTAKIAKGLNRNATGFEISKTAFDYQSAAIDNLEKGSLLSSLRVPDENKFVNCGKKLDNAERQSIIRSYQSALTKGATKKKAIEEVSEKHGRGYWSVLKIVDGQKNEKADTQDTTEDDLFQYL